MGLFGLGFNFGGRRRPNSIKPPGNVPPREAEKLKGRVGKGKIEIDPTARGRGFEKSIQDPDFRMDEEAKRAFQQNLEAQREAARIADQKGKARVAELKKLQQEGKPIPPQEEVVEVRSSNAIDTGINSIASPAASVVEESSTAADQEVQIATSVEPEQVSQNEPETPTEKPVESEKIKPESVSEEPVDHLQKISVPVRTEILREAVYDTEENSSSINMDPKNPKKRSSTFKVESPSKTLFKALLTGIVGIYSVLFFGYHVGMVEILPAVPLLGSIVMIVIGGRMLYISTSPIIIKRGGALLVGVSLVSGGAVTLAITLISSFDSLLKFFFVFH